MHWLFIYLQFIYIPSDSQALFVCKSSNKRFVRYMRCDRFFLKLSSIKLLNSWKCISWTEQMQAICCKRNWERKRKNWRSTNMLIIEMLQIYKKKKSLDVSTYLPVACKVYFQTISFSKRLDRKKGSAAPALRLFWILSRKYNIYSHPQSYVGTYIYVLKRA